MAPRRPGIGGGSSHDRCPLRPTAPARPRPRSPALRVRSPAFLRPALPCRSYGARSGGCPGGAPPIALPRSRRRPTVHAIGAERPGQMPGRRYHPAEPRRQGWSSIVRRTPLPRRRARRVWVGECPVRGTAAAAALRAGGDRGGAAGGVDPPQAEPGPRDHGPGRTRATKGPRRPRLQGGTPSLRCSDHLPRWQVDRGGRGTAA